MVYVLYLGIFQPGGHLCAPERSVDKYPKVKQLFYDDSLKRAMNDVYLHSNMQGSLNVAFV